MRTATCNSFIKCFSCFKSRQLPKLRNCIYQKTLFSEHNTIILTSSSILQRCWKSDKNNDISSVVIPVPIAPANNVDDINIGEELSKKINKKDILKVINEFYKQPEVTIIAAENGLDSKLFHRAAISFRNFCMDSEILPVDLHVVFSDILQGAGHSHDLLQYFLQHAREIFPHLECMEELKQISDLRHPSSWYPNARAVQRKLIFHAGPTNSGKTYMALKRFTEAQSGVYCGPLKLLSVEVCNKTNDLGKPCDLITGEERKSALENNAPADHVACTIEMVSVENNYEVAVIDEIQMIKDPGRGWAWTRALLGLVAKEIHICGEAAAIDLVREIASSCGEELEVREYKRLTTLKIEDSALKDLGNIRPGDCIVCFSKNDIFNVSLELERRGFECAVIYGSLPPSTKLAQAKKFNDPNHSCKILVATDAIGMGLNLSIRRVIFYSLVKPVVNEKGEKEIDTISTSQALQIAGRAGRYLTQFPEGYATTFRSEDLPILKTIMAKPIEALQKAGLHPTADQMELFAYHLPHATLSNLIDIFISLCVMDTSSYFMCDTEGFKFLAEKIQNVPLPLRARYVFCCAPINKQQKFVCTMFQKFSKQYSQNDPLTVDKLCKIVGWPFAEPKNLADLVHQEAVYDVMDLYLWLSYRFTDLFPDEKKVREVQKELDGQIQMGVFNITHLLKATEADHVEDQGESSGYSRHNDRGFKSVITDESTDSMQTVHNGRLTEELLAKGRITPEMLKTLQKEWMDSLEGNHEPFNPFRPKKSKVYTKRTKFIK